MENTVWKNTVWDIQFRKIHFGKIQFGIIQIVRLKVGVRWEKILPKTVMGILDNICRGVQKLCIGSQKSGENSNLEKITAEQRELKLQSLFPFF